MTEDSRTYIDPVQVFDKVGLRFPPLSFTKLSPGSVAAALGG